MSDSQPDPRETAEQLYAAAFATRLPKQRVYRLTLKLMAACYRHAAAVVERQPASDAIAELDRLATQVEKGE